MRLRACLQAPNQQSRAVSASLRLGAHGCSASSSCSTFRWFFSWRFSCGGRSRTTPPTFRRAAHSWIRAPALRGSTRVRSSSASGRSCSGASSSTPSTAFCSLASMLVNPQSRAAPRLSSLPRCSWDCRQSCCASCLIGPMAAFVSATVLEYRAHLFLRVFFRGVSFHALPCVLRGARPLFRIRRRARIGGHW